MTNQWTFRRSLDPWQYQIRHGAIEQTTPRRRGKPKICALEMTGAAMGNPHPNKGRGIINKKA